ncbi:cytochrome d ubiquinol oxidase subunit II [Arthrobacter crystallopoietes]|uniref:cytochrome d ubiquinol oxidase subunit II n=1 Tax=Crystallibacter crystallopoietes TaxID=37928 RepID=UPI001111336B|nr:cytochrome d ubiquinol oxidase subunit II [Arthrobacter crystallopoietes]QTG81548.1 hypothetical protein J5251_02750 [Arthrobacter crystallopoietes]
MDQFPESSLMRQRKMKRLAKACFALVLVAVALPVLMGLLGMNLTLPMSLLAVILLIVGVIIWTRSDPAYSAGMQKRESR